MNTYKVIGYIKVYKAISVEAESKEKARKIAESIHHRNSDVVEVEIIDYFLLHKQVKT